jgi:polysaccharide pyruvyl transferase WcaK-like protein
MATTSPPRLLICGYYGAGNFGDDLMLAGVVEEWRRRVGAAPLAILYKDAPPTVAAGEARWVPFRPGAIVAALRRVDAVVQAGGTMFHDQVPPAARRRYLSRLFLFAGFFLCARLLRRRVVFYGIGIGPLTRGPFRLATRVALWAADAVAFRDDRSIALASELSPSRRWSRTADPALALFDRSPTPTPTPPRPVVGLGLTALHGFGPGGEADTEALVRRLVTALGAAAEATPLDVVVFNVNASTTHNDTRLCERLTAALDAAGLPARLVTYEGDVGGFLEAVRGCTHAVAMRYHFALTTLASGLPTIVVPYHPKVEELASLFPGRGRFVDPGALVRDGIELADFLTTATGEIAPSPGETGRGLIDLLTSGAVSSTYPKDAPGD